MTKEDEITLVETSKQQPFPLQAFYDTQLLEVPPASRKLLHEYSKIPEDEIFPHVIQARESAWETCPYPCIGHYRFLDFAITHSQAYAEILERLKKGNQQFLDVGCCLGQELRQLVAAGVKSENLYGVDLHTGYFEAGYELFKDRDTLNSLFLPANIFDVAEGSLLGQLREKVDIIWCSGVLHLFNWRTQVVAVTKIMKLLKKAPATMIAGRLMGRTAPGEYPQGNGTGGETTYRHNATSFKKMFHEATKAAGEQWETDVVAKPWVETLKLKTDETTSAPEGLLDIWFVARKLERIDGATSHNIVHAWGQGDDGEFMY